MERFEVNALAGTYEWWQQIIGGQSWILRRTGDQDGDGKEGFPDVTKFHGHVCPRTSI